MEYYYTKKSNVDIDKKKLIVDEFEFKHLAKVLRKREGDEVTFTDGERNIFYCKISDIGKERMICEIVSSEYNLFEPKVNVSLYLSMLRNSDRFEFAVEKAVELGVSSIHPVLTDFTVSKSIPGRTKDERLNKIIIGAMGQSQRCVLPKLHKTMTLKEVINSTETELNKIVMYEFSDDQRDFDFKNSGNNVSLLIGPEGGFSEKEISHLKETGWQVRSLGKRKLRAETAAIVSVFDIISKLN